MIVDLERKSMTTPENSLVGRRSFVASLAASLVGCRSGRRKPNIVVFLADDLGITGLGCHGSRFHETPHIDRMAEQGMRFTQALRRLPGLLADTDQHHDRQVSRPHRSHQLYPRQSKPAARSQEGGDQ
jgi:hypothetical protein